MEEAKGAKKQDSLSTLSAVIILMLIVIIAGEYFYFQNKLKNATSSAMNMTAVTPPPLSDQQNQQMASGIDTSTQSKSFNITAGNYYFVPKNITVNQGDKVTFYVTNAGGVHDLIIDELGVKTPVSKTSITATFQFTASKKGSFVYYCSVPGHREKGMWGTLVVQ